LKVKSKEGVGADFIINCQLVDMNTQQEELLLKRNAKLEQTLAAMNRELEIEAALEKVRTKTMTMQKSDELFEVIKTIYDEFQKLEFDALVADLMIFTEDKKGYDIWLSGRYGAEGPYSVGENFYNHPHHSGTMKAWLNGEEVRITELKGEMFTSYFEIVLNNITGLQNLSEEDKNKIFSLGQVVQTEVFTRYGCIRVGGAEKRTEAQLGIQKRFAKVFDQSYTRFLDLKKAEAQAREAQIELGLERVRARAMAMHSSDELNELVKTLFEELTRLDVGLATCLIWTCNPTTLNAKIWIYHPVTKEPNAYVVQYNEDPFYLELLRAWKERNADWRYCLQGDEKIKWGNFLFTETGFSLLSDVVKNEMRKPGKVFFSASYYKSGAIQAAGLEPFSQQNIDILQRFSKVFDLSYTRFLDLQKAEAQAREAQIEAALEKVRSRSLAMHKSDELNEVVTVVFEKLLELEMVFDGGAVIVIFTEGSKDLIYWIASELLSTASSFRFPYIDHPMVTMYEDARDQGLDFFSKIYSFQDKNSYYTYAFEHSDFKFLPEDLKNYILESKSIGVSFALSKHSAILTPSFGGQMISEQRGELLKRFSRVFDQAYRRFLDLQQAEAQAREAQIEAALERVRGRAMAMHKSDELLDAGELLYRELSKLGITSFTTGYVLMDDEEKFGWIYAASPADGTLLPEPTGLPHESDVMGSIKASWKKQEQFHVVELDPQATIEHHTYLAKNSKNFLFTLEEFLAISPKGVVLHSFNFKQGYILVVNEQRLTSAQEEMVVRFTKVFEMTYRRFLDLQKAEAQAKEAKIEAALERVRAGAMAMHKSEELGKVGSLMFDQIRLFEGELWACGVVLCEKDKLDTIQWMSVPGIGMIPPNNVPRDLEVCQQHMFDAWKEGRELFMEEISGEAIIKHYEGLSTIPSLNEAFQRIIESGTPLPVWQKNHVAPFKHGYLLIITIKPFDQVNLFPRFARVFEQAYTRFLDLQKVEAQAREAKIETALEKVRSRTMAMQKSEELKEVLQLIVEQLCLLNFKIDSASFALDYKVSNHFNLWLATPDQQYPTKIYLPYFDHPIFNRLVEAKEAGEEIYTLHCPVEEKNEFFDHFLKYVPGVPAERKEVMYGGSAWVQSAVLMKNVGFNVQNYSGDLYSDEQNATLFRFGKVFEQTYTRFNDLKQAEAQGREAKIETALEKVRSRTMAMQRSDELSETAFVLFQQFKELNEAPDRLFIGIVNEEAGMIEFWITGWGGSQLNQKFKGSIEEPVVFNKAYKAWKEQQKSLTLHISDKDLVAYLDYLKKIGFPVQETSYLNTLVNSFATFSRGYIGVVNTDFAPAETIELLERFAGVFDLTYTRFLDLQKAEAQAKEATIEAALEKVRGKAMAMHNSNDLASTASTVFTELRKLGISPIRCGVELLNKESRSAQSYSATSSPAGDSFSSIGSVLLSAHPLLENMYNTWLNNDNYFPVLNGEQLKSYYELLLAGLSLPSVSQSGQTQYGHFLPFSAGCLYAWSEVPYNDTEIKILKRFASIIDLTFRRYVELQKSDANAREAIRRASLDRVRAETASMRTTADLEKITPLIWSELTTLGVPFIRCGVFIIDERQEQIHTFLSTPDGKSIAAFHLPFNTQGTTTKMLEHWCKKEMYRDHWDEEAFTAWTKSLVAQGAIASSEKYLSEDRITNLDLHFLPFLQGMLYVGNEAPLSDDEIHLVQTLADAFSTAYARYEDFNKLEAAKEQIEKTLVNLKQAQAQLVQAEKMASLGELTAGIAHEIQNPLNFINNFSDVNRELVDELQSELKAGNTKDAIAISNDIRENEEKINHHGKRADAIVKGMLQHSRATVSQKELTDINALTDEYLRLSYHGLRAKDKSFNVDFKTDFDESIGKIEVIPQDIGRVLLNLYNNAFYAASLSCNGVAKNTMPSKKPTVWVSTKKSSLPFQKGGGEVIISVRDNGPGIPKKIIDKIFQPFFTTKPTGQGTGLGLSLSYDIIKAHGGELKVETKEGEGAEFTIQLPVIKA
jgi:signal transduction histidine kinase